MAGACHTRQGSLPCSRKGCLGRPIRRRTARAHAYRQWSQAMGCRARLARRQRSPAPRREITRPRSAQCECFLRSKSPTMAIRTALIARGYTESRRRTKPERFARERNPTRAEGEESRPGETTTNVVGPHLFCRARLAGWAIGVRPAQRAAGACFETGEAAVERCHSRLGG